MKQFIIDNITILLGESAKENWSLFASSSPSYIWVHLESFPSGHVIIQSSKPSDKIIKEASEICKNHTKYRNLKNIKVNYTLCSNLKKGDIEGEVIIKSWKKCNTIKV